MDVFSFIGRTISSFVCNVFQNLFYFIPRTYKDISNDVILIIGGGRGIGRLVAMEFAKHHPKQIIIWDGHKDSLVATAHEVESMGVPCHYMVCDVGSRDQVVARAEEVKQQFGGVDILVNNEAVVAGGSVVDVSDQELQSAIDVNLMSQYWTIKAFFPHMKRQNHGHIVSINSVAGLVALGGASDYCASKFGAFGLHECLGMELVRDDLDGVHLTSIYHSDIELCEGMKTRLPSFFSPLDKDYIAWKIVNAICINQTFCIIPKSMYIFYYLKSLLPYETVLIMQRFLGMDRAVDS